MKKKKQSKHSKKTKHKTKLHGAALTAWKEKHGLLGHHTPRPHRSKGPPRAAKHKVHKKCSMCEHADHHDAKAGCLHFDGKKFCSCKHR